MSSYLLPDQSFLLWLKLGYKRTWLSVWICFGMILYIGAELGKTVGVGFFIKNHWEFQVLEADRSRGKPGAYECIFIKFKPHVGKAFTVGVIYTPPGNDPNLFSHELDILSSYLTRSKDDIFPVGIIIIIDLQVVSHARTRTFFNQPTNQWIKCYCQWIGVWYWQPKFLGQSYN